LLIASPLLLVTVFGDGFEIGSDITDSAKAALGSAYNVVVPDHGVELRLSGEVTYGLADRLARELDAHPDVSRIRLESGGGEVNEAFRVAQIIAAHKLDTVVSGECASACTDIFMAGMHRTLEKDGRLGFHVAMSADPTKGADDFIRKLYIRYGVDKGFIARAETTKPADMWYPTREELMSEHILTEGQ
jgi:hypothetical protein